MARPALPSLMKSPAGIVAGNDLDLEAALEAHRTSKDSWFLKTFPNEPKWRNW
jgi:hypothetical protein